MARCPMCDYENNSGLFFTTNDKYVCRVTGLKMDLDDPKVELVCKADSGYEYEKCEAYQKR